MLGAYVYHHWAGPTPLWLTVVLCLPTVIAVVVLIVVLIRERRKRDRP